MKIARWARLLVAVAPFLAGCSGFWDSPSSNSSNGNCTSNCTTATSGDFYILNAASISGYYISSGTLTKLSGSPYSLPVTGASPYAMAINPAGTVLYVSTNVGIFSYTIGSGGALTLTSSTAVYTDSFAGAIQVDSTGTWLLDASSVQGVSGTLYAIPVTSSGAIDSSRLVQGQPPSLSLAGTSVQQMAISPDNKLIAVALGSAGTQVFSFAPASGTLTTNSKIALNGGVSDISVAFGPQTSLLYIGEVSVFSSTTNSAGLRILPISSDVLGTEPVGSPYASGGTGPHSILPLSSGYVYVANWVGASTGNVTAFQVTTGTTPALSKLSSSISTGTEPVSLAEDANSKFLLAVSSAGSPYFNAYTFDTSTAGALDAQITGSTGAAPIAIVAVP